MVIQSTENPDTLLIPGFATATETSITPTAPKPTVFTISELRRVYNLHYRTFHANCNKARKYYFGNNSVPVPNDMGIDPVKPATSHALINIAADHIDINNITILVPDPSPRAKDRSERIQKFLQGAWMHIDEKVKKTAVRQEIAFGISFLKFMWDGDQWPDAPVINNFPDEQDYKEALKEFDKEKGISFPFAVKNVNPENLIWDDSRVGPKWAIEQYSSNVGDIQKLYPEWQPLSKRSSDMVMFSEYWDGVWMVRLIDNDIIYGPVEHGYGFMPYAPVVPGTSLDWDVGRPEDRYRSILQPVYNLLDTEARLMTQYEAILRQYSWPRMDFKGPSKQAQNVANAYTIFGGKNIVLPGVEVVAGDTPTPPQEILQQLQNVRNAIEEATFPNVVRGLRPTGISSGFGVSVLAGMGRLVFGSYATGMARAMESGNRMFLKLIENKAKGRVTVRARGQVHSFDQSIGPDDIRGFYENRVFLKAEAPEEREREALLANTLWNGGEGLISEIEAMRRAGVTNPLEEMNQKNAERLLRSDAVQLRQSEALAGGVNLPGQIQSATGGGVNSGQFQEGVPQLQRPGEANIQQARTASQQGRPSVFPQGSGGVGLLGRLFGSATGGGGNVPSGQSVK